MNKTRHGFPQLSLLGPLTVVKIRNIQYIATVLQPNHHGVIVTTQRSELFLCLCGCALIYSVHVLWMFCPSVSAMVCVYVCVCDGLQVSLAEWMIDCECVGCSRELIGSNLQARGLKVGFFQAPEGSPLPTSSLTASQHAFV